MAKSKPKTAVAKPAKAKAAKPKAKPKAVKVKAKPKTAKAAKPKAAAPKAKGRAKPAEAAAKPKTVKKSPKPKAKPKKSKVDLAIVVPRITNPGASSTHTAGQDLTITATTNDTTVRYRIVVTDVTNPPPYPAPTDVDLPAPGASPFNGTIPGATFAAGKTYSVKLIVYPPDGATPPNVPSQIQVST